MWLSYRTVTAKRSRFSPFGYASAGVTAGMFVLPLLVFLGSAVAAGMLRRPGAVVAWADALRQASAAQATLFIALPLMGLLVGLIGLASRQSRCPLSAACAALNGVVAVCVYFQGA